MNPAYRILRLRQTAFAVSFTGAPNVLEEIIMKILLRNLTKRFPDRNKKTRGEITAVNDLTLEIPDGKLVGLLGPSGCGKSTTLNLICGLEKATEGTIFFGDWDVTA